MSNKKLEVGTSGKMVTVRFDDKTWNKLREVMASRDVDQSTAIRLCICHVPILKVGNSRDLAREFCRLRESLEEKVIDPSLRKGVEELCQSIKDVFHVLDQWSK
mgnify:CR=1 FL=1